MKILRFLHSFDKGHDETLDKWFFMSSPTNVLLTLFLYFAFVYKIGPWFMENREPFKLRKTLFVYNSLQILYCIVMIVLALRVSRLIEFLRNTDCNVERSPDEYMAHLNHAWHYVFMKLIDLLDTVFFVLRKKYNQISFLHVYHHSLMLFMSWCYIKYSPGTELAMIGIINTGVHAIMYTYYLLAAMGPQYQKYLWWKKYMTRIQMLQFLVIIGYFTAIILKGCRLTTFTTSFTMFFTIIFFCLFFDFYRKTYSSKSKKKVS